MESKKQQFLCIFAEAAGVKTLTELKAAYPEFTHLSAFTKLLHENVSGNVRSITAPEVPPRWKRFISVSTVFSDSECHLEWWTC